MMQKLFLLTLLSMMLVSCAEKQEEKTPILKDSTSTAQLPVDVSPEVEIIAEESEEDISADSKQEEPVESGEAASSTGQVTIDEPNAEQLSTPTVSEKEVAEAVVEKVVSELEWQFPVLGTEEQVRLIEDSFQETNHLEGVDEKLHLIAISRYEGIVLDSELQSFQFYSGLGRQPNIDLPVYYGDVWTQDFISRTKNNVMAQKLVDFFGTTVTEAEKLSVHSTYYLNGKLLEIKGNFSEKGKFHFLLGQFDLISSIGEPLRLVVYKRLAKGDIIPTSVQLLNASNKVIYQNDDGRIEIGRKSIRASADLGSFEKLTDFFRSQKLSFQSEYGSIEYDLLEASPKIGDNNMRIKAKSNPIYVELEEED